jgi:tetratricopeptide (TPR) repeat protein
LDRIDVAAYPPHRNGAASGGGSGRRLIGWKAIGQFLGCTERTARRWEADRALPVHRIPGSGRSSVWANAEELTAWLQALPSDVQATLREEAGPPDEPTGEPAPESATPAAIDSTVAPELKPEPLVASEVAPPEGRWPFWRLSAVALGLLLIGAGVFDYLSRERTPAAVPLSTAYDDNAEARSTYMNARYELSTRSATGLNSAQRGFQQLVDRYPERAAGWSGLAETYLLLREFGSLPDRVAYPEAERAARAAIALDPRAATAWLDEAFITWWWQGDGSKAFAEFTTALRLDPNSARAHHWYATALAARGDFQRGLEEIARARALSPDNRAIVADEAYIRYNAGGSQSEAITALVRLTQLDPGFESPHFYLSRIYLRAERDADFLAEARTAARLRGQDDVLAELDLADKALHTGGRQAMLDQLSSSEAARWQSGRGSAVFVAEYRALAHDRPGVLRWLTIAAEGHDHNLPCLNGWPEFSPYLKDPEFAAIVSRRPG